MEYHEFASVFPLMAGDDLDALVEDVRANGLHEPIMRFEGKILDGRNRHVACTMAGIEPRYRDFQGTREQALAFVYSENFHRRHLTDGAMQLAAGRYKEISAREAKQRQKEHAGTAPGKAKDTSGKFTGSVSSDARDAAGEKFNLSGKTVDFAERVLKHGSPELIKAVESGQVKVSTASRLAQAPKAVQAKAIKEGKAAIRQAIEQHAPSPSEEAHNDPGVKWHKSMYDIRSRLISTRELGGIEELTAQWSSVLIMQYRDDIAELIKELETWKKALTAKLKRP